MFACSLGRSKFFFKGGFFIFTRFNSLHALIYIHSICYCMRFLYLCTCLNCFAWNVYYWFHCCCYISINVSRSYLIVCFLPFGCFVLFDFIIFCYVSSWCFICEAVYIFIDLAIYVVEMVDNINTVSDVVESNPVIVVPSPWVQTTIGSTSTQLITVSVPMNHNEKPEKLLVLILRHGSKKCCFT